MRYNASLISQEELQSIAGLSTICRRVISICCIDQHSKTFQKEGRHWAIDSASLDFWPLPTTDMMQIVTHAPWEVMVLTISISSRHYLRGTDREIRHMNLY